MDRTYYKELVKDGFCNDCRERSICHDQGYWPVCPEFEIRVDEEIAEEKKMDRKVEEE